MRLHCLKIEITHAKRRQLRHIQLTYKIQAHTHTHGDDTLKKKNWLK